MKYTTLFFFLILFSCNGKSKILTINTMKVVMVDMIAADEWIKIMASKDSSVIKAKQDVSLYNKIFSLNKITKEQFYNSYNYYQNSPLEMKILMDSMNNYANRKRDSVMIGK